LQRVRKKLYHSFAPVALLTTQNLFIFYVEVEVSLFLVSLFTALHIKIDCNADRTMLFAVK